MFQITKKNKDKEINIKKIKDSLLNSVKRSYSILYNAPNFIGIENINKIVFKIKSHISTSFNEYLIILDRNEFLKRYYLQNESRQYLRKILGFYKDFQIIFPMMKPSSVNKYIYINTANKDFLFNDISNNKSFSQKIVQNKRFINDSGFQIFFSDEDQFDINEEINTNSSYSFKKLFSKRNTSNLNPTKISYEKDNKEDSISSVEHLINTIYYAEEEALNKGINKNINVKGQSRLYNKAKLLINKLEENNSTILRNNDQGFLTDDFNPFYYVPYNNTPKKPYNEFKNNLKSTKDKLLSINKLKSQTSPDPSKNISREISQVPICKTTIEVKEINSTNEIRIENFESIEVNKKSDLITTDTNRKKEKLSIFEIARLQSTKLERFMKFSVDKFPCNNTFSKNNCLKTIFPSKSKSFSKNKFNSNKKKVKEVDLLTINTSKLDEASSRYIISFLKSIDNKEESVDLGRLIRSPNTQFKKNEKLPKVNSIKKEIKINKNTINTSINKKQQLKKVEIKKNLNIFPFSSLKQENRISSIVPKSKLIRTLNKSSINFN